MQSFRKSLLRWPISACTALIFLNMGFFLMEVKALGLDSDPVLMENISRMMAVSAPEEERDCSPQPSSQNLAEEEYLAGHGSNCFAASYFLIAEHSPTASGDDTLKNGFVKRFCPPPEV